MVEEISFNPPASKSTAERRFFYAKERAAVAKSDLIKNLKINDFGPTKKQQTVIDHLGTYRFISYAQPLRRFVDQRHIVVQ